MTAGDGPGEHTDVRALATVELLGALTYAQLRAFDITAAAVRYAPDSRAADQLADLALSEHHGYVLLRERLRALTDLPSPALDRQRARADTFFDKLPVDDWLSACTFFSVGLPIAADFARAIAPRLDDETAAAVLEALANRDAFEQFANVHVLRLIATDDEARVRARHLVADITGRALTQFQAAITDTDALRVLLGGEDEANIVRRVAMQVLDSHHRRMASLGLDEPD